MRALCYDPDAPAGLRLVETAEPVPGADEALVAVRAIAFNVGEVVGVAGRKQPGDVLGWDAAGVVVQPAADGSGPPAGARVVTFGWAWLAVGVAFAAGSWLPLVASQGKPRTDDGENSVRPSGRRSTPEAWGWSGTHRRKGGECR